MKIAKNDLIHHETKRQQLNRFVIGLTILTLYTIYLVFQYGPSGIALGAITWSAFVIATPIADGGLLLDFPIRLMTGMRMIYSEIIVWVIAISLNIYVLFNNPVVYERTIITNSFHQILVNPWPNWIIIFISLIGTFVSIFFGDELLDVVFHKQRKKYLKHNFKYKIILVIFGIILFYFIYQQFLHLFGLQI